MPVEIDTLLFLAAVTLAATVHAVAGFGFGLIAVTAATQLFDIRTAVATLSFASLAVSLTVLLRLRRHLRWEGLAPLILASLVGVPIGIALLRRADPSILMTALGVLLVGAAIQGLFFRPGPRAWPPAAGVLCGLLSGALAGAFGTGGPPATVYILNQHFDRFRHVASIQAILLIGNVVRLPLLVAGGEITWSVAAPGLVGAAIAALGSLVGLKVLDGVPTPAVKRLVLLLLAVVGIRYVIVYSFLQ